MIIRNLQTEKAANVTTTYFFEKINAFKALVNILALKDQALVIPGGDLHGWIFIDLLKS